MKHVCAIFALFLIGSSLMAGTGSIDIKSGSKTVTNGFTDLADLKYPNVAPDKVIVIDDVSYTSPEKKCKAFVNAIASGSVRSGSVNETPAIIVLKGTVDLSGGKISDKDHSYFDAFDSGTGKRVHNDIAYDIGSNKAIIGCDNAKIAFGGLRINSREGQNIHDVIIQNITFWDAHGSTEYNTKFKGKEESKASADQLVVQGYFEKGKYESQWIPYNIWIDHCTFTDGTCNDLYRNFNHDGALDIKAVHNMTVSYCEFTNHDKVTLIAPGDGFTNPRDRTITFHHNYYHGATQRMPRSRGCYIHLYNNAYDNIGNSKNSGYSLGPGIASQYIIENNYFGKHQGKILRYADKSKKGESTYSYFYNSGNVPELDSSNSELYKEHHSDKMPFEIKYDYSLMTADEVKAKVPALAGTGLTVTIDGVSY